MLISMITLIFQYNAKSGSF